MIRVPAVLVGVMCACVLALVAFVVAWLVRDQRVLIIALPLIACIGGFIDGRCSDRPAPVPGMAVGILILAARVGLSLGLYDSLLYYVDPLVALLELIAAITGGLMGTMIVRRRMQQFEPRPEYRAM